MTGVPSSHPTFEDAGQPAPRARDRIGDGKYVVFKVDEFYDFCVLIWNHAIDQMQDKVRDESIEDMAEPLVVMDATVLRDQDILTAPALNSYADAALTVYDLLDGMGYALISHLHDRADFFRARAMRAQQHPNRKLPD